MKLFSKMILNSKFLTSKISSHIFLFLFFIGSGVFANPMEVFEKGNSLYSEGNYTEAKTAYSQLILENKISSSVYFNLGNCFYKINDVPNAILNYEKALKLNPENEDALFNLKMANQRTVDKIERLPDLFIGSSWKSFVLSKSVSTWAYFTVGLLFLSMGLFIGYLLFQQITLKKIGFYMGIVFLVLSMSSFLFAAQHQSILDKSSEAIIFAPSTPIKSEPNNQSEKLFTLHEGTKVTLLEENKTWSKIKLPNGNIGWIESEKIKSI